MASMASIFFRMGCVECLWAPVRRIDAKEVYYSHNDNIWFRELNHLCPKGELYWFKQDNKFCQILQLEQVSTVLQEFHGGIARGYFSSNIRMKKILMLVIGGQQWILMFMNTTKHVINVNE
jgi:hypothetical protein